MTSVKGGEDETECRNDSMEMPPQGIECNQHCYCVEKNLNGRIPTRRDLF